MQAECRTITQKVSSYPIPADLGQHPAERLAEAARHYGLRWLLVHADDGIIWGELRDDGLHLSTQGFPKVSPELRGITLQQARLFGPQGELFIWRADDMQWQGRLIQEGQGETVEVYDDTYLLWGTNVVDQQGGFALLQHGAEGFMHAPPVEEDVEPPFRLMVRHTLCYDDDGLARVAYSRLVAVQTRRSS